jgi:phage N-6-adenine-methyltransferase
MKTGPSIDRANSRQDFGTPNDFIAAVRQRFGEMSWDLAASAENTKAAKYYSEEVDSLKQQWVHITGPYSWLNPPFSTIRPWAKKCFEESEQGAKILLLVPAAVGSNWFSEFVHDKAVVLFLSPRLCFDGKNPYPKDCLLAVFNKIIKPGYQTWRWK